MQPAMSRAWAASWLAQVAACERAHALMHHGSAAGIPCHPSHPRAVRLSERHADAVGSLPLVDSVGRGLFRLPLVTALLSCDLL